MNFFRHGFLFIWIFLVNCASAQEVHFSQFNNIPTAINPALTGVINGDLRVQGTYRAANHLDDSYRLALDSKINLNSSSFIGIGVEGFKGEEAFRSELRTQGSIATSYGKFIKKDSSKIHSLVGGISFSVAKVKSRFFISSIEPSQDTSFYNPPFIPHPELARRALNCGLTWMSSFGDRKSFYFGLAVHDDLIIHGGGELPITQRMSLAPSFLFLKKGSVGNEFNVGANVRFSSTHTPQISYYQFGLHRRSLPSGFLRKGLVVSSALKIQQFIIALAYDSTPSTLIATEQGQAIELSVGYVLGGQKEKNYSFPRF